MRVCSLWAAGVWVGLVGLQEVHAQSASMCPDRPIRFTHYEYGLFYSNGNGGIDDDIQKELEQRSGCKFEVTLRPRARTWADLESGAVDMAGSAIQTPERDRFAWFYHYVVESNVVVLGPKVPASVHSFAEFLADPKLSIGGVRSYRYSPYYDPFVDKLIAQKRHVEGPDPGAVYRMFGVPRFDAFITSPILYLYYIKQHNLPTPPRIENWDTGGPTPSGLVLSKKSFTPAQAAQWGALIQNMLADGTVQKIAIQHLGTELGTSSVYRGPSK